MRSCERCLTPYKTRVEFCGLDGAPVVEHERDPLIGRSFDRYRVIERLGGGGMAVVYRARHEVIDREVAIKILFGELAADREFAERFRREAQAASRIKHPNVVEIVDFGETPEGMSFLVMEMLRGETLGDAIHGAGRFSPRRAANVLRQLASGLKAAHDMGFIHRDLKPGNVMLTKGGEGQPLEVAKILDFGLVLIASDEGERLTRTGQTLGTPHYMAPEQFAGGEATVRSDLYSLGAVLHEMLAGQAPFRGSLADVVVQQQAKAPPPLPKSGGLEKLAAKLLDKDPRKRPASTEEVIAFLDKLALGEPRPEDIPAKPETLDLDLAQVVEVRPIASHERTEALDAPPSLLSAPDARRAGEREELRGEASRTNKGQPEAVDVGDVDAGDDERVTREGLEEEGAAASAPDGAPDESARSTRRGPETEYVDRSARAAEEGRGQTLLRAALLGGLALSGGLLVVAGPWASSEPLADTRVADASPTPREDAERARIRAVLERRGLTLEDAADMEALAPLLAAWRDADESRASDERGRALTRLLAAIESAPIETPLLVRKLARVEQRIGALPTERRAALEEQANALGAELGEDLSAAERSRFARRLAELEALVDER